jgi:hypothetical protein
MDMSCYKCGNPADRLCPACGRFFCSEHGQNVAEYDNRVFCKGCLVSEQRMMRFFLWFCLPILVLSFAGLIIAYFFPYEPT